MTLTSKGNLRLGRDEELVVRLTSTGGMYSLGGRTMRLVGRLRGYHWIRGVGSVGCAWNNCHLCDKGEKRDVRIEAHLLWEGPNGLEERKAYLTMHVNRLFAKVAEVIEAEGRNPADVRIRWRFTPGRKHTVEVTIL